MAPKPVHPESMVSGMSYNGTIDILHDKSDLYEGHSFSKMKEAGKSAPNSERDLHGNFVGKSEKERVHYHASLKRGQNTANVCIARLLMRYLAKTCKDGRDGYDPREFIEVFQEYLTTPPIENDIAQLKNSNDIYLDVYCRYFFEQASKGVPLMLCAHNQRDSWSIGSLDGVVMAIPLIAAYASDPESFLIGRAIEHHMLTHRSVTVSAAISLLVPLLLQLWEGRDADDALDEAMSKMRSPKITGEEMGKSYVKHHGPGNIPKDEKWRQHMETSSQSLKDEIRKLVASGVPDQRAIGFVNGTSRFASACYTEQGMACIFFLACKYRDNVEAALSANAQVGGHSTARGALLGAILGARVGAKKLPQRWIETLAAPDQVKKEVTDVIDVVSARFGEQTYIETDNTGVIGA
eukprot:CAMPEP_0204831504 /NCGR_PEP_ID=MMETSP1346-20131115/10818_1 /ASSEMBLY_ACC=CAM_ASM_000771 /TAXON_ID=215587 /ORGANISM="Aplanochytrium stocchinoi, Strain GSBS06" /LENGTH=407 /DNA_ID=CAMNT_0051962593 /DNA_START=353 /DNA_END=1576 /DNA_ORIENTATION=+